MRDEGLPVLLVEQTGRKVTAAARSAGLAAASMPALLVEGDDRPGLGHAIAQAMADAGTDLDFLVAQVLGKRYTAVIGFATADDAANADRGRRKLFAIVALESGGTGYFFLRVETGFFAVHPPRTRQYSGTERNGRSAAV